jgi:hypothetical protein
MRMTSHTTNAVCEGSRISSIVLYTIYLQSFACNYKHHDDLHIISLPAFWQFSIVFRAAQLSNLSLISNDKLAYVVIKAET